MRNAILTLTVLALAAAFSAGGCKSSGSADQSKKPKRPPLYGVKAVFVVAQKAFRDEELAEPRKALEQAGAEVRIACKEKGSCAGMMGAVVNAELALAEVDMEEF
ncbi:MAG: DJ-1/PfpI family protein, partial [Planctomycetota bacterium]